MRCTPRTPDVRIRALPCIPQPGEGGAGLLWFGKLSRIFADGAVPPFGCWGAFHLARLAHSQGIALRAAFAGGSTAQLPGLENDVGHLEQPPATLVVENVGKLVRQNPRLLVGK